MLGLYKSLNGGGGRDKAAEAGMGDIMQSPVICMVKEFWTLFQGYLWNHLKVLSGEIKLLDLFFKDFGCSMDDEFVRSNNVGKPDSPAFL